MNLIQTLWKQKQLHQVKASVFPWPVLTQQVPRAWFGLAEVPELREHNSLGALPFTEAAPLRSVVVVQALWHSRQFLVVFLSFELRYWA